MSERNSVSQSEGNGAAQARMPGASTPTVFGTPLDITLAELAIESFFPADAATAQLLGRCGVRT